MASRTADEVGPFTMVMRLIFKNILMHICLILGGMGNILTLIVLMEKRMRRASTTQYLSALTLFDMVYLVCTFVNNVEIIYPETKNSGASPYLNLVLYPLSDFCGNTSVYLILMFTIERYLAVAYPLHSRYWCRPSRARKIIGLTILFCLLFTSPTFLENKIIYKFDPSVNHTMPVLTETDFYPNFKVYKLIYFWLIAVIAQFIPLTILIILNGILMKYIHKSMTNKKPKVSHMDSDLSSANNFLSPSNANLKSSSYVQIKANEQSLNNLCVNSASFNNKNKLKTFNKFSSVNSGTLDAEKCQKSATNHIHMNSLAENGLGQNSKLSGSINFKAKKFSSQNSVQLRCNVSMQQSEQNKATLLLVVTVLVFLICQVPGALLLIWEAIFPLDNQSETATDVILGLNNIANGLVAINASINFILYSCFSEKFRQTFQRLFFFKKKPVSNNSAVYKAINSRTKSMGYM